MKGRASWDWWSLEGTSLYQQEVGWSLVPKQALSRCCRGPVISCKATCWQMSRRVCGVLWGMTPPEMFRNIWSSSSPVSQPLSIPTPFSSGPCKGLFLWSLMLPAWAAKPSKISLPWKALLTKNKAHPTYHSRASMACPPLFLYHGCNVCTFTISFQTAQKCIK